VSSIASGGSDGKFTGDDGGFYGYRIVSVSNDGFSAPVNATAVEVAASEKVTITLADQADAVFYKIYRSEKAATSGAVDFSTARLIGEIKNTSGAATVFVDDNSVVPNTSKIVFVQHDPTVMEFVRLLDFFRRPLAETATSKPFLLMLFGAPIVKVPNKCFVLQNAGVTETSGMLDTTI
jgi:hypothetical protein